MQIENLTFNPYLYQGGGNIHGDYTFQDANVVMEREADIELADDSNRLQQKTDKENYLCFKPDRTYINKNLEVIGDVTAPNIFSKHGGTIDGSVTIQQNLLVQGQTDLQGLTAQATSLHAANVAHDLTVSGATDLQDLAGHEDAVFDKKVTADTIACNTLELNSLTIADLHVTNDAIVDGSTTLLGITAMYDNASVHGALTAMNGLDVTGDATMHNQMTVNDTLTVQGITTLQDDANVHGTLTAMNGQKVSVCNSWCFSAW